jgi:hypothetical protein
LYLAQLLRANPVMAIALLICLATILWCILLTRRQRNGLDKALTGLLGLIAIYDALRILKDSGIAAFARFRTMEGWVDLISACLYLMGALILKTSSIERSATKVHLRERSRARWGAEPWAGLRELPARRASGCGRAQAAPRKARRWRGELPW